MKNILLIIGAVLLLLGLYMQFGGPAFDDAWPTWSGLAVIVIGVLVAGYALLGARKTA